ncbi:unnamed protein product [Arctogadus glacialis]
MMFMLTKWQMAYEAGPDAQRSAQAIPVSSPPDQAKPKQSSTPMPRVNLDSVHIARHLSPCHHLSNCFHRQQLNVHWVSRGKFGEDLTIA